MTDPDPFESFSLAMGTTLAATSNRLREYILSIENDLLTMDVVLTPQERVKLKRTKHALEIAQRSTEYAARVMLGDER